MGFLGKCSDVDRRLKSSGRPGPLCRSRLADIGEEERQHAYALEAGIESGIRLGIVLGGNLFAHGYAPVGSLEQYEPDPFTKCFTDWRESVEARIAAKQPAPDLTKFDLASFEIPAIRSRSNNGAALTSTARASPTPSERPRMTWRRRPAPTWSCAV